MREPLDKEIDETVYSREFNGTPRRYMFVSVITGLYLGVTIYLIYALSRHYLADDTGVFSMQSLAYVGLFCVIYPLFSYRVMMKYDGKLSSGRGWSNNERKVKLIERKRHRRFG